MNAGALSKAAVSAIAALVAPVLKRTPSDGEVRAALSHLRTSEVSVAEMAARLGISPHAMRSRIWRSGAKRVRVHGGQAYYDYDDVAGLLR